MDHPELGGAKTPEIKAMEEFRRITSDLDGGLFVTEPKNPWTSHEPYVALLLGFLLGWFIRAHL